MSPATNSRLRMRMRGLRQEQRALRHDIIEWLGRPWVFVGVLLAMAALQLILGLLPGWVSTSAVVLVAAGMWRAGKHSHDRRRPAA